MAGIIHCKSYSCAWQRFAKLACFVIILALSLVAFSCRPASRHIHGATLPPGQKELIQAEILPIPLIIDSTKAGFDRLASAPDVFVFYKESGFRSVWANNGGVLPVADSMIAMIRSVEKYGLFSKEYGLNEIETLLSSPGEVFQLQKLDLLLTDAYFTMARHLRNGRLVKNSMVRSNLSAESDSVFLLHLHETLKSGNIRTSLESLEPAHAPYSALKAELACLIEKLKQPETLTEQELVLTEGQLTSVMINMERWRWEADTFPERYILINIPSYKLQVFDGPDVVLESKVIVGAKDTPTPVLESTIWCFTVYPYWNVPRSIATKEMLPVIRGDSTYLGRNFYEVLDARGNVLDASKIDWTKLTEDDFPYYIRQGEGENNALGIIKFTFDNPYSVYLHDTNAKGLFNKKTRALSHGCIRMEKAQELAYLLVKNDTIFSNPATLQKYFTQRKRTEVNLTEPIPIYIRYFTAAIENEQVVYHPDIYSKDEQLLRRGIF